MRSIVLLSVFSFLLFVPTFAQRSCVTHEYSPGSMSIDPEVKNNADKPRAPHYTVSSGNPSAELSLIVIPVVVHILYHEEFQNISIEQIRSQIDALNKDFRKRNPDTINIPAAFRAVAADAFIVFRLATLDPSGAPSSGIVRKKTSIEFFGVDDRIKSSAIGGDDPWDRDKYLNIWVGNLAGGVVGYASIPGSAAEKDGVVIRYNAFGSAGTAAAPYNKGRTATHEIGHWLGLRHIWGDAYCGDDKIDDTPPQQSASRGCPSGMVLSCANAPFGNMYMNFMDFTNDDCINMFTRKQAERMHELFAENGSRRPLLSSDRAFGAPAEENAVPAEGRIKLYPNPVTSQLTITFGSEQLPENSIILIYNYLGQLVRQVRPAQQTVQLDMSSMRAGIYYISLGDKKKSYKFVKL